MTAHPRVFIAGDAASFILSVGLQRRSPTSGPRERLA
jgi:hypothetical protein